MSTINKVLLLCALVLVLVLGGLVIIEKTRVSRPYTQLEDVKTVPSAEPTQAGKSSLIVLEIIRANPNYVTIEKNESISFMNRSDGAVTLTIVNGSFSDQIIKPSESIKIPFPTSGKYEFQAKENRDLHGTIVVK